MTVSSKPPGPVVHVAGRSPSSFALCSRCVLCSLRHPVVLFVLLIRYHPTDFTVMNETQNYDVSF